MIPLMAIALVVCQANAPAKCDTLTRYAVMEDCAEDRARWADTFAALSEYVVFVCKDTSHE